MTNKETVNRNVGLSFDFIRQIVRNPEMIDKIENNSTIEFLQKDYPTMLPQKIVQPLKEHLIKVKAIPEKDLKNGFETLYMPYAIE